MGDKRLTFGRLQVNIEPRDVWAGLFIALNAVYVCPLPLLVIKWLRSAGTPQELTRAGKDLAQ